MHDPVDRKGACVTVRGAASLLGPATYELAEAVTAFARRPAGDRNRQSNERDWGRIRALALNADARLDGFLGKTIILTPDKLDLGLRRENVGDMTVVEVVPLVDGAPPDRWVRTFDAYGAVQSHYDVTTESGELIRIIPDDAVRSVLAEIKQMPGRRVSGRRAEAFLRNPYAALGEDVAQVIQPGAFECARRAAGVAFFSFTPAVDHDDHGHVTTIRLELSSDLDDAPPIDDIALVSRSDELVPKNWTDGLALALISNPQERIRRR